MVELKCNRGNTETTLHGDIAEIGADMLTLLHVVFRRIFEDNTMGAMTFRACIEANIEDAFTLTDAEIAMLNKEDENE